MNDLDYTWVWPALSQLFTEQGFITVVCGLLVVSMTLRFYKFIRGIHPMLVPLTLLLAVFILLFHWTQTRTEPKLLTPAVDYLATLVPAPTYQGQRVTPAPAAKPPPPKPAPPLRHS